MTKNTKPLVQKMTNAELQPILERYLNKLDVILETDGRFVNEKDRFTIVRDINKIPVIEYHGQYTQDLTLGFLIFMDSVGIGLVDVEKPAGLAAITTYTVH